MEGKEILAVVDSVSSEKGLEKDVIFVAMELAIASASQRHFHEDAQLLVEVDRESGEFITKRKWEVLDESDEEFHRESHISPSESSSSKRAKASPPSPLAHDHHILCSDKCATALPSSSAVSADTSPNTVVAPVPSD